MNEYSKTCPGCGKLQLYKNKYKLERAIKANTSCNPCVHKRPSKLKKDLTGKIYGRLVVLQFHEKRKNHQYWLCGCDCGNKTVIRHSHLTRQTIRSCGCSHFYTNKKHPHWSGYEEIPGSYFGTIKTSAKRRNFEFSITIQDIWEIFKKQNRKCALSGSILEFNKTIKSRAGTASLDRIDSLKGYTKDNVQWVHKHINIMKQDLKDKEFVNFCKQIVEYRKDLL